LGNPRKRFFFEKKKQKLLIPEGAATNGVKCFGESKFFAAARGGLLFVHKKKFLRRFRRFQHL
jgi:hypothetical protein